jgi:hypothetical protein
MISQFKVPKHEKYYISNLSDLKSLPKKLTGSNSIINQPSKPNRIRPLDMDSFD